MPPDGQQSQGNAGQGNGAGEGTQSGATDIFSQSGGNSGGASASGQSDGSNGAGASGSQTSGSPTQSGSQGANPTSGANGSGPVTPSWRDSLDPEMREHGALKNVPDVKTLAKNYLNAQSMIGADKVVIPGAKSTPEDWKNFYTKIGVPEKVEDYKINAPAEVLNDEVMKGYLQTAHSAGILPRQAEALSKWFQEVSEKGQREQVQQAQVQRAKAMENFKQEEGDQYNATVAAAKLAMNQLPDDIQKHIREAGLGADPKVIRAFALLGKPYQEGTIKGQGHGGNRPSVEQALANIQELKNNPGHAYWNEGDPGYQAARKEADQWYKIAFPEK